MIKPSFFGPKNRRSTMPQVHDPESTPLVLTVHCTVTIHNSVTMSSPGVCIQCIITKNIRALTFVWKNVPVCLIITMTAVAFMLALHENIFERSLGTTAPVRCHTPLLLRAIIATAAIDSECSPTCKQDANKTHLYYCWKRRVCLWVSWKLNEMCYSLATAGSGS